jgi:hypothetical protein
MHAKGSQASPALRKYGHCHFSRFSVLLVGEVERLLCVRVDMEARVEELKRNANDAVALAEENQMEAEGAKAQAKSARTAEEEVGVRADISCTHPL